MRTVDHTARPADEWYGTISSSARYLQDGWWYQLLTMPMCINQKQSVADYLMTPTRSRFMAAADTSVDLISSTTKNLR